MLGVFILHNLNPDLTKSGSSASTPFISAALGGVILRSNCRAVYPYTLSFHDLYAPWRSSLRQFKPLVLSLLLSVCASHTVASKAHAPLVSTLTAVPCHGDRRDRLTSGTCAYGNAICRPIAQRYRR